MNSTKKNLEKFLEFRSKHAGVTTCLMCDKKFKSPNKRSIRRCSKCRSKERGVYVRPIFSDPELED